MAANKEPVFTLVPNIGALATSRFATANSGRDGTGTLATILTAGTDGSRVDRIVITATSTTTAGMVRLYISDGTNIRLWKEIAVTAITPSATVLAFTATVTSPDTYPLLVLPGTYLLRASTNNAESFDAVVHGGNF